MSKLTKYTLNSVRKDSVYQAVMYDLVQLGIISREDFDLFCPSAIIDEGSDLRPFKAIYGKEAVV